MKKLTICRSSKRVLLSMRGHMGRAAHLQRLELFTSTGLLVALSIALFLASSTAWASGDEFCSAPTITEIAKPFGSSFLPGGDVNLAVSPTNPSVLVATGINYYTSSLGTGGISISTNAGIDWKLYGLPSVTLGGETYTNWSLASPFFAATGDAYLGGIVFDPTNNASALIVGPIKLAPFAMGTPTVAIATAPSEAIIPFSSLNIVQINPKASATNFVAAYLNDGAPTISKSTDGGETWKTPTAVPGSPSRITSLDLLLEGSSGRDLNLFAWVATQTQDTIYTAESTNGGTTWGSWTSVTEYPPTTGGGLGPFSSDQTPQYAYDGLARKFLVAYTSQPSGQNSQINLGSYNPVNGVFITRIINDTLTGSFVSTVVVPGNVAGQYFVSGARTEGSGEIGTFVEMAAPVPSPTATLEKAYVPTIYLPHVYHSPTLYSWSDTKSGSSALFQVSLPVDNLVANFTAPTMVEQEQTFTVSAGGSCPVKAPVTVIVTVATGVNVLSATPDLTMSCKIGSSAATCTSNPTTPCSGTFNNTLVEETSLAPGTSFSQEETVTAPGTCNTKPKGAVQSVNFTVVSSGSVR